MGVISKETWNNIPEKERDIIIGDYKNMLDGITECPEQEREAAIRQTEWLFGKENLQPNQIRTWEDCQEMNEDSNFFMRIDDNLELPDKVYLKCQATLKIAKLLNLGYGGMVTEEEWKNDRITKYCLQWTYGRGWTCYNSSSVKSFPAFHTFEQRAEFMSHPENVELVKQYYML